MVERITREIFAARGLMGMWYPQNTSTFSTKPGFQPLRSRCILPGCSSAFHPPFQVHRHAPNCWYSTMCSIGLDTSNRIPVLNIPHEHFADWQIILLTHDRVWYEIVHLQTEASKDWLYHELYYATTHTGYECPVHRGHNEGWPDLLKRARQHLHDNDERAAAVYARAAFERKLQRYCERHAIPVRYHTDPRRMDAQWFWDAIKKRLQDTGKLAASQSTISQIEAFRKIVLNPLSHANTTTVTRAEIQGAIDAVEALNLQV